MSGQTEPELGRERKGLYIMSLESDRQGKSGWELWPVPK